MRIPLTPFSSPVTSSSTWSQRIVHVRLPEQLLLQDLLGAELVPPVHDRDVPRDVREVERLLDRRVPAADHRDVLAAVEEAVAGRARGDAAPHVRLLRREPEVTRRGAGRDDQRVAGVDGAVAVQAERARLKLDRFDLVEHDLGLEPLRVLLEALHQLGPLHAVRVRRPVVDVGRRHQLAAGRETGDEHGLQVGARRVDRGRVAGRAGPEDEQAAVPGGLRGHFGCRRVVRGGPRRL